jgi:hypothetical protein
MSAGFHWIRLPGALVLLASLGTTSATAQQPGQKTYGSPGEATLALVAAARQNDESALLEILGPDGRQIVSSGDSVEDARDRTEFVARYQEMHRLVQEPDGTTTLYIGARNWPTPIPLVDKGGAWFFDTQAGTTEILCRRVGQNETLAIQVCRELVTAQQAYFTMQHNQYAGTLLSDEGRHNGLYWKAVPGDPQSPLAPLMAAALAQGYGALPTQPAGPYNGYRFRVLGRQGRNAPGGAQSYSVHGRMTKGFAFVAYPVEYRASGVMTFIVDHRGEVLQKDLGRRTTAAAKAMSAYDPGPGWVKAEALQETLEIQGNSK